MGLCYSLGLFLAHEGTMREMLTQFSKKATSYEMWFYGAADHMFEFRWQDAPTEYLRQRCSRLQEKLLVWRLPMDKAKKPTEESFKWAIQETKDLLRLIDKAHGIKTIKGDYE